MYWKVEDCQKELKNSRWRNMFKVFLFPATLIHLVGAFKSTRFWIDFSRIGIDHTVNAQSGLEHSSAYPLGGHGCTIGHLHLGLKRQKK